MDLTGKVALVTGGAIRVGKVLSLKLAKAGADVVISHFQTEREAEETKVEIEALGRRCLVIEADMRDFARLREMVDIIEREFGRLDILVHNASNYNVYDFLDVTEEIWDSSQDIIVKGPFFLSQAASKLMMKHQSGRIIALIGNTYYENWPNHIPHAVAKTGLAKVMQGLAVALSPYIQCYSICPDNIMPTALKDPSVLPDREGDIPENMEYTKLSGQTFVRGNADMVADLLLYLCTCTSYLTGNVIRMDGGRGLIC